MKPLPLLSGLFALTIPCLALAASTDTTILYLSGHDKDDAVPWQFTCSAGNNANTHSTIPVPSNWELHNFGTFTYGVEHRGSKTKPAVPIDPVQGQYTTTFTPSADLANRRAFLVFEGVMTDTQAILNGQSVGPKHQGGYFRFKYEVTSLIKPNQLNTLQVTVDNESADPTVNNAERRGDYFNYSGIYRPVYLESLPQQFVDHVAINATTDGTFSLDAFTDRADPDDTVEAQILELHGSPVAPPFSAPIQKDAAAHLTTKVSAPHLWTAETPNLYQVEVRLKKGETLLHTIRQRFGFRMIEVRDGDGLYVNGKRILLKGCDRHTFWPDSGRCTSEKISRDDISLMHEMNMNAVRMSHYPPDQHFLDAADEMGLYVLDELPGWHGNYGDEVGHKLVKEMLTRDVNHPAILFWDNGNEGGWNTHLDADFPAIDPQHRHVLHPWALNDHVDTKHYPDFKTLEAKVNGDNVYFPTEMVHGLYDGGAGASLADYWDVIRHGKSAAGGFIWAFLDEAPKRVDLDGRLDTRGNLAPDGIVGPYREKEGSFFTIKQLWSPVVISDKDIPDDGQFTVENRYDFLNLKQCKFSYQLRKFPGPFDRDAGSRVIAEGPIASPDVPPGSTGKLQFHFPPTTQPFEPFDALTVRIENPAGQELFTPVFPLPHSRDTAAIMKEPAFANGITSVSESGNVLTVTGVNGLHLTFDKSTGQLASAANAGKTFSLANGPRLVAGEAKLTSLHADQPKTGDILATVTANYSGNMKSALWSVHNNGWVDIDAIYNLTGTQDFIGLGFDYPEKNVKALKWLGDGPYRVYKNRLAGPTLNVWQNEYNDSITGSIPWKYPEFKGYFANIRWAQYQTTEGPITFVTRTDNLFLQNFTPSQPDKSLAGKTLVPYPTTSIAFLHAIPPIGTKFSSPTGMGPSSQTNAATGEYHTQISIYFGDFPSNP